MPSFKDFDEVAASYGQKPSSDWFRPKEENSKIHILSEYEPVGKHWDNIKRRSSICIGKERGCPMCLAGDKPNACYRMWVIDRKDGEIKPAELPYGIMKQIKDLQKNPEYEFDSIPPFDITIIRTVKKIAGGQERIEYSVQASRQNVNLTLEEQEAYADKKPMCDIIQMEKDKLIKVNSPSSVDTSELPPDSEQIKL